MERGLGPTSDMPSSATRSIPAAVAVLHALALLLVPAATQSAPCVGEVVLTNASGTFTDGSDEKGRVSTSLFTCTWRIKPSVFEDGKPKNVSGIMVDVERYSTTSYVYLTISEVGPDGAKKTIHNNARGPVYVEGALVGVLRGHRHPFA